MIRGVFLCVGVLVVTCSAAARTGATTIRRNRSGIRNWCRSFHRWATSTCAFAGHLPA